MKRLRIVFAVSVAAFAIGAAAVVGLGRMIDHAIDQLLRP